MHTPTVKTDQLGILLLEQQTNLYAKPSPFTGIRHSLIRSSHNPHRASFFEVPTRINSLSSILAADLAIPQYEWPLFQPRLLTLTLFHPLRLSAPGRLAPRPGLIAVRAFPSLATPVIVLALPWFVTRSGLQKPLSLPESPNCTFSSASVFAAWPCTASASAHLLHT